MKKMSGSLGREAGATSSGVIGGSTISGGDGGLLTGFIDGNDINCVVSVGVSEPGIFVL